MRVSSAGPGFGGSNSSDCMRSIGPLADTLNESANRTIPKSTTFATPFLSSSTFSGLKSRWISPSACAAARPRPTSMKILITIAPGALLGGNPTLEGAAAQVLHGEEYISIVYADVEDRDDVRVRQLGDRLGLANQALLACRQVPVSVARA